MFVVHQKDLISSLCNHYMYYIHAEWKYGNMTPKTYVGGQLPTKILDIFGERNAFMKQCCMDE